MLGTISGYQSVFADPGDNESKTNIILATSFSQLPSLELIMQLSG